MKDVLSVILGGGRGTRLYPLTKYRAKPAVPLVGKYRLVDIPISNCLNSGIHKIFILTQFNSGSLNKHIFRGYKLDAFSGGFVEIIAAEQSDEQGEWFQGSADAVRKCLKHFNDSRINHILILSGDQLYRMNFEELLEFHLSKKSDITIACNTVSVEETNELGIIGVNKDYRINKFIEKPKDKKEIKDIGLKVDGKDRYLASMGLYLFNKEVLFNLLRSNNKTDFGKEVIPEALASNKIKMSAFVHQSYWKDIGSISSFYEENLAFLSDNPPLNLYDEDWQFFTRPRFLPMSKIINSFIQRSDIGEGAIIEDSKINHSIIGLRSKIGSGTVIEDSIIMGNDFYEENAIKRVNSPQKPISLGIGKNCIIKKAIVDKNVRMGDNVKLINKNNLKDFENEMCVIKNGIIIIPKNTTLPSGFVI